MERILLDNLAANQSFDAALRRAPTVDRIVGRYLDAILFQADAAVRQHAISQVEDQLVDYFSRTVTPAAQQIGEKAARKIIVGLGPPAEPLKDEVFRQQVLVDLNLRNRDRLKIVQTIVNDKANTLDNRLAAYWLEPGRTSKEKLAQLRDLHDEMTQRREEYETAQRAFEAGETEKRPRKPQLDFDARFTGDVKQGFRQQARRVGTDAETKVFVQKGFASFAWITVNATDACPDCRKRQGVIGDVQFWDRLGRPGAGNTVCGQACFCMLVPAQTLQKNPNLNAGLFSRSKGVFTTDEQAALLDSHR